MTKIMLLITSLLGGGAERVVSELSFALGKCSDCQVVTLLNAEEYSHRYKTNKVPISLNCKIPNKNLFVFGGFLLFIIGSIQYIMLLRKERPEASISNLELDAFINLVACKITGVKPIVVIHTALSQKCHSVSYGKILRFFIRHTYNSLDSIVAVSEGIKDDLVQNMGIKKDKISVIYNPIDTNKISKLKEEEVTEDIFSSGNPIILTVGSLKEVKGQWHLIRVFGEIRKIIPCKLVLCGDGDLKEYLQNLITELQLSNDVVFLGWVSNPYKYMYRSTIFVLPSLREGLPTVLIEALASGCSIVSTDCMYGPSEILEGGKYGVLTMPQDGVHHSSTDALSDSEQDLSNKILELLLDKSKRIGLSINGLERAQSYAPDIAAKEYLKVIWK